MENPWNGFQSLNVGEVFGFHPTDEELVWYYLRRKICGINPFRCEAIPGIHIYKSHPWDFPGMSKLNSTDMECYFFCMLDGNYGSGRLLRATEGGYWKATGKDRPVYHNSHVVGGKKTLVYYTGLPLRGTRTDWMMHEYRLIGKELAKAGNVQDDRIVLCRLYRKPEYGKQYRATFEEDDELEMLQEDQSCLGTRNGDLSCSVIQSNSPSSVKEMSLGLHLALAPPRNGVRNYSITEPNPLFSAQDVSLDIDLGLDRRIKRLKAGDGSTSSSSVKNYSTIQQRLMYSSKSPPCASSDSDFSDINAFAKILRHDNFCVNKIDSL